MLKKGAGDKYIACAASIFEKVAAANPVLRRGGEK